MISFHLHFNWVAFVHFSNAKRKRRKKDGVSRKSVNDCNRTSLSCLWLRLERSVCLNDRDCENNTKDNCISTVQNVYLRGAARIGTDRPSFSCSYVLCASWGLCLSYAGSNAPAQFSRTFLGFLGGNVQMYKCTKMLLMSCCYLWYLFHIIEPHERYILL